MARRAWTRGAAARGRRGPDPADTARDMLDVSTPTQDDLHQLLVEFKVPILFSILFCIVSGVQLKVPILEAESTPASPCGTGFGSVLILKGEVV